MWRSPLEAMPKDDAAYSDQQQGGYLNPSAREQGYTLDEVLASMPSGAVLGIAEKPRWVAEWQAIQAEYPSISSEPLAMHSTYLAAYAALRDYLDTLPTWSDLSTATAITRTTWDGKWADYYAARSALFTRLERQALGNAAAAGDAAATAQGTANGAATAAANAQTTATNAQTAANAANSALADIAADGKLTPSEKQSTRLQWDTILGERAGIQSGADAVSVSRTAYDSAFQTLATYLNAGTTWSSGTPSWLADANLSTTTTIDGPTFRANWKALFDARQALLNAITAAVQAAAANAQTAASAAAQAAADAQSTADGKIDTFWQASAPTASGVGDLWFDTDDGNKVYRWSGSAWVNARDSGIATAITAASTAQGTADGKARIYYQASAPTGLGASDQGDLWVDTDGNLAVYAWNGTAWVLAQDWFTANAAATAAQTAANSAQTAANNAATAASYADRLARSSNNLIKNGNSEDANPTGFEAAGVDSTPGFARNGSKCRSITTNSAYTDLVVTPKIQCTEGDEFYFEGWARSTRDTYPYSPRLLIRFVSATDTTTQWNWDEKSSLGTSSVKLAISGKAPAGTVAVEFRVDSGGTVVGGGIIAWDDFYACRKVSAGMLEADILKALLIKGEVIETPNYVPGSAGVPPVGARVAGAPWTITLLDGTTIQGNMELGEGASIAGHPALSYANMLLYRKVEFASPGAWSWTVPAGVRRARITVCGAGGGGKGGEYRRGGPGGRNGATLVLELTNLTQGQVISGANGASGAGGGAGCYGGAGGASTLTVAGKTWTINGGAGGGNATTSCSTLTGGYGTTCTASERKTDLLDGSLLGGLNIQSLRYATGASGALSGATSAAAGGYGSWLAPGGKGGDAGTAHAFGQAGAAGTKGSGGGGGGGAENTTYDDGGSGNGGDGSPGYALIEY